MSDPELVLWFSPTCAHIYVCVQMSLLVDSQHYCEILTEKCYINVKMNCPV